MEICAQITEQKHKHSLPRQRLPPSWRQYQRRLCSILTDSLSVLQSLASGNPEDNILRKLIQSLNSLKSRTTAILQWVPAHTGIHGNEVADQLAKVGNKEQQPKSKLSYQEAKTLIRNKGLADYKHRNGGYDPPTRFPSPTIAPRTDIDIPAKNRPMQTT